MGYNRNDEENGRKKDVSTAFATVKNNNEELLSKIISTSSANLHHITNSYLLSHIVVTNSKAR